MLRSHIVALGVLAMLGLSLACGAVVSPTGQEISGRNRARSGYLPGERGTPYGRLSFRSLEGGGLHAVGSSSH